MNKIHLLKHISGYFDSTSERRTLCGLVGWGEPHRPSEFSTSDGGCFEVIGHVSQATCMRCINAERKHEKESES